MPPILPTDVPEPEGSEDETANAPVPAAYHADDSSDDEDVDLGSGDEEYAGYQLLPQVTVRLRRTRACLIVVPCAS